MPTFTFSEYDVGNTLLVPDDGGPSLSISTTRGSFGQPKMTTIQVVVPGAEGTVLGGFEWKNETVEIAGIRKPSAKVKREIEAGFTT